MRTDCKVKEFYMWMHMTKNSSPRFLLYLYYFFIIHISVASLWTSNISGASQPHNRDIKILVLIISSHDLPVYNELQQLWRSYMHSDPEHVEAYFIEADPLLKENFLVTGDILWSKTVESTIPGILNKTILSLEACVPRLHEFDYVLRTNLSSFYVFDRLLNFLKNCTKERFYCGVCFPDFVSGAGYLLSPDLVELLVKNMHIFLNNNSSYDDVLVGQFMMTNHVRLTPHKRMDFLNIKEWEIKKNHIPKDIFQFRIKTNNRPVHDPFIMSQLIQMFYSHNN